MAMGFATASSAGRGTGAISRGAPGDAGSAATAMEETAALGAGLRAAAGDGGFGGGFVADAVAAIALYPGPDCGAGASMTAGPRLADAGAVRTAGAAGVVGAAGLRSLA